MNTHIMVFLSFQRELHGWGAAPSRKMARSHLVWRGRGGSFKLPLESIRRLNEPPRRCELIVIRRYSPPCTTAAPPQGGVAASSKKIWRSHRSRRSRGGFPFGFIGKPPRPRDKRMLRDIF